VRLHSPAFEKSLRRQVRQTIRSSPELKREFRAARKVRRRYGFNLLLRPMISFGVGAVAWGAWQKTGHLAAGLAVLTLWGFIFVFMHAQRLISSLYAATDLQAFALLPVRETTVFRWELQRFLLGTLWSLLDLVCGYSALAWRAGFSLPKWCAVVPLGMWTWIEVIALAVLCVSYFPRLPYALVSGLLTFSLFILVLTRQFIGPFLLRLLDNSAPTLNLVLPTGWPVSLFQALLVGNPWNIAVFLLPSVIIVYSLKNSLGRLQAHYTFTETVRPEAPDLVPDQPTLASAFESTHPETPTRLGPTAIEDLIQTGFFLAEPAWRTQGPFESAFWRWCTPRERALAEFVFPTGLAFAKPWRNVFRNLLIAIAVACLAGLLSPELRNWVLAAGLFVALCQVLACVLGSGRAFQTVHCGGVNIALYANYAIGFRELGGFLFKYSLTQFPLVLLFCVAAGMSIFYVAGWPFTLGAVAGFKAAGLLLASRFVFLTFSFSAGTNDTSRFRFSSVLLVCLAVSLGVGFVGLAAASLLWPSELGAWSCWAAAALEGYIFFRVYGWFYHRNQFDLMNLPRV
jgi:hypothetical protein